MNSALHTNRFFLNPSSFLDGRDTDAASMFDRPDISEIDLDGKDEGNLGRSGPNVGPTTPLFCKKCSRGFTTGKALNEHLKHSSKHKELREKKCPVCSRRFKSKADLAQVSKFIFLSWPCFSQFLVASYVPCAPEIGSQVSAFVLRKGVQGSFCNCAPRWIWLPRYYSPSSDGSSSPHENPWYLYQTNNRPFYFIKHSFPNANLHHDCSILQFRNTQVRLSYVFEIFPNFVQSQRTLELGSTWWRRVQVSEVQNRVHAHLWPRPTRWE